MDRSMLYELIYALAARDGREGALFGDCALASRIAFQRSLVGDCFPELWFEIPLSGNLWFDLHALATREDLNEGMVIPDGSYGGNSQAISWFASEKRHVKQLALSWDVSSGDVEHPAVQLLVGNKDADITCDFLEVVGRKDAAPAYRAFVARLPQDWFPCYAGVFPRRVIPFLRVECIPTIQLQTAYAQDTALLKEHLSQAGFSAFGKTLLPYCQELARMPFGMEFQFDIKANECTDSTIGVSLRFADPSTTGEWKSYDQHGEAGALMRMVQSWGLADDRWLLLADTAFATNVKRSNESVLLYCYPTFLKLRWRDGEPLDAKAYLKAGVIK